MNLQMKPSKRKENMRKKAANYNGAAGSDKENKMKAYITSSHNF